MAKTIMIQGTMSNVGKSLITAALCRIFRQDGYTAAPFKSQNMALNSFITSDGLELGRAQAIQAQAAMISPSADMNPILLKPTSDTGSQVILHGKAIGNMPAREYFRRKTEFIPYIMESFGRLSDNYDIVVIEGAGSPVELNLKQDDIVNMGMAKLAKSPVLLVGDIDRGGVFAQLLGTLSLLEEDEQRMVKGLVVNKFRGDKSLFSDGTEMLSQRGGKPVVGLVPYISCDIEDEDSLSDKLTAAKTADIDIAVIHLPKISNFTDFDVFSQFSGVSVRYVRDLRSLKNPDLIIIPGTKSTISDLLFLRESGLEAKIKESAAKGVPIIGICGGYQILGKEISDPFGAERGGTVRGMGLLNTQTVFAKEKTTTQIKGKIRNISDGFFSFLSGAEFEGYEIHHGVTEIFSKPLSRLSDGREDGTVSGNVIGTYIHGIFDSRDVCVRLVSALYKAKGLQYHGTAISREDYRTKQFDILAEQVRENIDMQQIYRILEEGI